MKQGMNCISSFHGKIKEIPGIGVDNFNNTECRAYFLSHCHTDHTEGLFSTTFLDVVRKNNVTIYMSEITADIIVKNSKDLDDNIERLKIGTTLITLPSLFDYEEQYVSVTVTSAGHCFGSVMFLFQTNKYTVLYTGDFRIKETDVPKLGLLHDIHRKPIEIDVIYADTTFLDIKYSSFPKRSTCVDQLLEIIQEWLKVAGNAVALNMPAKFGYEYLYNDIYKKLKLKVFVNNDRYKFYRDHPTLIRGVTNNEAETKIHACANFKESKDHELCVTSCSDKNFLLVRLTAMKWREYDLEQSPIDRVSDNKLYACFPTHCSRSELIYFINYFSPKRVIGFPEPYKECKEEKYIAINSDQKGVKRKLHQI